MVKYTSSSFLYIKCLKELRKEKESKKKIHHVPYYKGAFLNK